MTRENLSEIKASDVQILFADLQKQLVARSKTTAPDTLSRSAAVLAQLAKLFQLPVILSVVPEAEQAPELIPELAEQTSNDPQFLRLSVNPFLDGATREALASSGRKTLIIAGFATEAVGLVPFVRVTQATDEADIHRALEAGAMGIFLPEIDSVEDVKKAADAAFYPPKGNRGICPAVRAAHYNDKTFFSAVTIVSVALRLLHQQSTVSSWVLITVGRNESATGGK